MAYISLYRKYRPSNFDDVVGQEIVVSILKNSIVENKIGHAYIFSGPRGTGKTSIAKIFAKAVNCLNNKDGNLCGECEVCTKNQNEEIDIVEIDAASNNGVDEIREIRNNTKLLPIQYKYKVYIIDEVHMLSPSAFNALLKTLEEPPSHVIFILATTEFNKIPTTVVSRCQKFDFKKIKTTDIIKRIKHILELENKGLDDEIIEFIAKLSNGGLRDAINLLDQVLSLNKKNINIEDVYEITGYIKNDDIFNLLKQMFAGNIKETYNLLEIYSQTEKNYMYLCNKMIDILKDLIIYNNSSNYFLASYEKQLEEFIKVDVSKIMKTVEYLLDLRTELRRSNDQRVLVEVYFLKILLLFSNGETQKEVEKPIKEEKTVKIEDKKIDEPPKIVENKEEIKEKEVKIIESNIDENLEKIRINNAFFGANKELKNEFIEKFDEINDYISNKEYTSIASLLLKSKPEVVSDKNIIFRLKKDIDKNLFNINLEEVQKMLKLIYKKKYSVIAVSDDEWKLLKEEYINNIKNNIKYEYIEEKTKKNEKKSVLQDNIEDIFGDEYVKEE